MAIQVDTPARLARLTTPAKAGGAEAEAVKVVPAGVTATAGEAVVPAVA